MGRCVFTVFLAFYGTSGNPELTEPPNLFLYAAEPGKIRSCSHKHRHTQTHTSCCLLLLCSLDFSTDFARRLYCLAFICASGRDERAAGAPRQPDQDVFFYSLVYVY